jgi:hypothetical protein
MLNKGSKAILTIPPQLAYGSKGSGKIPANSTLIFEVEMVDCYDVETEISEMGLMDGLGNGWLEDTSYDHKALKRDSCELSSTSA